MKNKIRVFEAFAGYGSQSMALRRLGIDFQVVGISEIDKYAIQAYMAVHGDTPNYGDISKIDWSSVPDFDFLTYSFPCTDISTAGQQKGLAEGSGTRSSLLWECRKAIEAKRPKYLLMENVKNLVSKKFTPYLKEWLRFIEGQGYSNYTKVLNAKDFGVPQNRERVFMVSILGEVSFHFPKPFTLEKRLKDVLEKDVDESFYLSEKVVNGKISPTLTAGGEPPCLYEGMEQKCVAYTRDSKGKVISRRLSDIANTVHGSTGCGGSTDCFVVEPKIIQVGNLADEKGFKNPQRGRVYNPIGISPNINTMGGGNLQPKIIEDFANYRIRKLTPRECFRLMGVSEKDIDNIQKSGISKTQQYKMAGNSIVVDVLYYIFKKMFVDKSCEDTQLSIF